ncbi:MAG: hypothetical protein M1834_004439 [Cirrosporium novae-zelandiae]|nr:MAG: hypothetical protein M1834_004439 [Cirrosporium novae-zelandiae]
MPPRLRVHRTLAKKRGIFFCPNCSLWRLTSLNSYHSKPVVSRSFQSQSASSVAIRGAPTPQAEISPRLKNLHEALNKVNDKATNYVSLSRLQLALRSLESRDPIIRVAVLGINGTPATQKFVRLLVSDPLKEEGTWEKELYSDDGTLQSPTTPGLLLRYGEEPKLVRQSMLISSLAIPSHFLHKHNLEILISTIETYGGRTIETDTNQTLKIPNLLERALVPILESTDSGGRYASMTHPVHKTLIYGEGVDGIINLTKLDPSQMTIRAEDFTLLKVAMDVAGLPKAGEVLEKKNILPVVSSSGANALAIFRKSVNNSLAYEQEWTQSKIDAVIEWVSQGTDRNTELKPVLRSYFRNLLQSASENIEMEETLKFKELQNSSVSEKTRGALLQAIDKWAEFAHTELQKELDRVCVSKNWRKLAWWKLFWRADDVAMIASEIMERNWLIESEKEIIFVVGRLQQAGLLPEEISLQNPVKGKQIRPSYLESEETGQNIDPNQRPERRYWPIQIPDTRLSLTNTTVPPLQSRAQSLLLQTISTTTLTAVLSGLLFVSVPAASLYSAGTIAAFGLVYSLKRLQSKWEQARERWVGDMREQGAKVLREVEAIQRYRIENLGRKKEDEEIVKERGEARAAVERAMRVLDEMEEKET